MLATTATASNKTSSLADSDKPAPSSRDPRRVPILAASIYRELRSGGMSEQEVLAVASELLKQVAQDLRASRG